jgi:four helix bundle protein
MQDFRKLVVWQRARKLARVVYTRTERFPHGETFGLRSQMRRAAVSICSNIAEGCGRGTDRDFRRLLGVALGSACALECELILSGDVELMAQAEQNDVLNDLEEIKRMLAGLIKRLSADS